MDRIIEKKKWPLKKILWVTAGGLFILLILYYIIFADKSSKLRVQEERLTIASVEMGYFQDYITNTGTVEPIRTVYIDALEGGQVEEILIEEGAMVKEGDIILRLSNTNLHLSIMNREASLAEQINNLRNTRLLMEQNKLDLKSQLIEINYAIIQAKREYEQIQELYKQNFRSKDEYQNAKEYYEYLLTKKDLLIESQKQDSLFRDVQISQLEESVLRMEDNLNLVRKKLESLDVRAPVNGQLTSLNAEIGESKGAGQRLGQINVLDSYKINAQIDEHYISRVQRGLIGEFEYSNKTYKLELTKIYPEVRNGQFSIDMEFIDDLPQNMRIGQTFRIKLELGAPKESLLIPRGGFYQSTGGQWIFVVDESGNNAYKRDIRLNRYNPKYYEVIEGVEEGERVIVSSYETFGDVDVLILKKKDNQ
ncbi:MAG: HlyD family efflux transporter periplasmic adaptor subunit [Candidatus Cloacimonetes bacterium]|nr:HlyD family efflux transporter periplasmic adaptor subunit [Candidatus Cloacimonadota bacterium]